MADASYTYDFFIAHAGSDTAQAEELYAFLVPRARVFLDSKSIRLGDDWDAAIEQAQRASFVTIVIVSSRTERAYYQRVEIAAAIAMARRQGERHRVVPLFLEDNPETDAIPYGLGLKHGLKLSDRLTLAGAAERLQALVDAVMSGGAAAIPSGAGGIAGAGVVHQPPKEWKSP